MNEQNASRELDRRVAVEVMELALMQDTELTRRGFLTYKKQYCLTGDWLETMVPHFSEDIAAAYQVESRIAELGLEREYMAALWDIAYKMNPSLDDYRGDFLYKHATPEMICQAALKAREK